MKLDYTFVGARLRAPFASASGALRFRELLLIQLEAPDGTVGHGEAAPLMSYDGVTIDDVRAALEDCRATLHVSDGTDRAQLLAECARRAVLPQAIAAIDLALWDLEGRRTDQPVWRLLASTTSNLGPEPIPVNATIAAEDRAGAGAEAAAATQAGFVCIKVKVGLGDDAGRIAAVRAAAGPRAAIRIDANGAWSVAQAAATLRALEPAGIELCEEPVTGIDAIEALRPQTGVPLAIDETSALPGALDRRLCDSVCLKIARCGGITGVIDAAARARAAGYNVYLASTLDGPLGIAAALHAAVAVKPERPCGLATLSAFETTNPIPATVGRLAPPRGRGLGDDLLSWYGR